MFTGLPGSPARFGALLAAAALASALAGVAAPAVAQGAAQPVQLSAKPVDQPGPYFDLTVNPGETSELTIALGNHGAAAIAARTYAADVYTIINGGFGAGLRDATTGGTTAWLDYPTEVLTLQSGLATLRTFSVSVPDGTPAGEYVTSVVLENDAPIKGSGGVALDQVVRQAVAVAVRVPGPLRGGLSIGVASHKVAAERSVVAVEVSNTGDRRLTPSATIVLHDESGTRVSEATVAMDSFYARTTTKVEITLETALQPGRYTVDLTLHDDERDGHAATTGLALTIAAPVAAAVSAPPLGRQVVDVLRAEPAQVPARAVALAAFGVALALALAGTGAITTRRRRAHRPMALVTAAARRGHLGRHLAETR